MSTSLLQVWPLLSASAALSPLGRWTGLFCPRALNRFRIAGKVLCPGTCFRKGSLYACADEQVLNIQVQLSRPQVPSILFLLNWFPLLLFHWTSSFCPSVAEQVPSTLVLLKRFPLPLCGWTGSLCHCAAEKVPFALSPLYRFPFPFLHVWQSFCCQ